MGKSIFEQMGGQYVRQGDYELPALAIQPEKEQKVGVWGQRHRRWLKNQHRVLYYNLLTSCKLYTHLGEVEERATAMFDRLVSDMTKAEGVTEKLKATDMMAWVGRMNNILSRATEVVNAEVIFSI